MSTGIRAEKQRDTDLFIPLHPFLKPDVPSPTFHLSILHTNAALYWEGNEHVETQRHKGEIRFPMEIFHGNWRHRQDISVKPMLQTLDKPTRKHVHNVTLIITHTHSTTSTKSVPCFESTLRDTHGPQSSHVISYSVNFCSQQPAFKGARKDSHFATENNWAKTRWINE